MISTPCDGHGCGGCEDCFAAAIRDEVEKQQKKQDEQYSTWKLQTWDIYKDNAYDSKALAENFEKIDRHDMSPGKGIRPLPMKLGVPRILCEGSDKPPRLSGVAWTDEYGTLVSECRVCENMALCYEHEGQTLIGDHLAKPQGHRCSECAGPLWREDEYMCVLCTFVQGQMGG